MTSQQILEFILRFLHMLGAAGLLGGILFMRFGLWPSLTASGASERERIFAAAARKFAPWVGIFAAFVLISGIYNMMTAMKYDYPSGLPNYNAVVGVKFLLGLGVIALLSILCGRTSTAERFRKNASMWLDLCLLLTLAIVLMAGLLKISSASRVPKATVPTAQQP